MAGRPNKPNIPSDLGNQRITRQQSKADVNNASDAIYAPREPLTNLDANQKSPATKNAPNQVKATPKARIPKEKPVPKVKLPPYGIPNFKLKVEVHVPEDGKFAYFPRLPLELRKMIWALVDADRTVTISVEEENGGPYGEVDNARLFGLYFSSNPKVLQVNKESREYGLTHYTKAFVKAIPDVGIYFNFASDELFFDSRRALVAFCSHRYTFFRSKWDARYETIPGRPTAEDKMITRVGMQYRAYCERWDGRPDRIENSKLPADLAQFSGVKTVRVVIPHELKDKWETQGEKIGIKPAVLDHGEFEYESNIYKNPEEMRAIWESRFEYGWVKEKFGRANFRRSEDPTKFLPKFLPDFQNFNLLEKLERSRYLTKILMIELKWRKWK